MAWTGSTPGWRPCGWLVPQIPASIAGSRRGRDSPGGHGRSRSRVPVSGRWPALGGGGLDDQRFRPSKSVWALLADWIAEELLRELLACARLLPAAPRSPPACSAY